MEKEFDETCERKKRREGKRKCCKNVCMCVCERERERVREKKKIAKNILTK